MKIALAAAAPVCAAAIWGRWIAPKASRRLTDPARLAVELMLFGLAAIALLLVDEPELGIILGAVYIVDAALLVALGRRGD